MMVFSRTISQPLALPLPTEPEVSYEVGAPASEFEAEVEGYEVIRS